MTLNLQYNTQEIDKLTGRLVEYVLQHRKGKAFHNWSVEAITNDLRSSILNSALVYCSSPDTGEILGLVHGVPSHSEKLFYVKNILITGRNVMPTFIDAFDRLFPDYKLAGRRQGKYKQYKDTNRVKHLLKKVK